MTSMHERIYLSPPHLGEREEQLVLEAFRTNWIAPLGPHVDAFEHELCAYTGAPHAVALSSGTAALHLALEALGIGASDEVWVSTLTFAATRWLQAQAGTKYRFPTILIARAFGVRKVG